MKCIGPARVLGVHLPEYVLTSYVWLCADNCVFYHQIKHCSTDELENYLDGLQQLEAEWRMEFYP